MHTNLATILCGPQINNDGGAERTAWYIIDILLLSKFMTFLINIHKYLLTSKCMTFHILPEFSWSVHTLSNKTKNCNQNLDQFSKELVLGPI